MAEPEELAVHWLVRAASGAEGAEAEVQAQLADDACHAVVVAQAAQACRPSLVVREALVVLACPRCSEAMEVPAAVLVRQSLRCDRSAASSYRSDHSVRSHRARQREFPDADDQSRAVRCS